MTIVVYWVDNGYIKYQLKYRKTGSMILFNRGYNYSTISGGVKKMKRPRCSLVAK